MNCFRPWGLSSLLCQRQQSCSRDSRPPVWPPQQLDFGMGSTCVTPQNKTMETDPWVLEQGGDVHLYPRGWGGGDGCPPSAGLLATHQYFVGKLIPSNAETALRGVTHAASTSAAQWCYVLWSRVGHGQAVNANFFRSQCIGAGSGQHQPVEGFDEVLLQLNKAVNSAACCKRVGDVS